VTREERSRRRAFIKVTDAVSVYLKEFGWSVIVAGRPRVQRQPDARDFSYEFVLDFTGGPTKPTTPAETPDVEAFADATADLHRVKP
jgi:hypothetical protein